MGAIVLAAGASSRMRGSPKALLRHAAGQTFVERAVGMLVEAGVGPIAVVTRPSLEDEVRQRLTASKPWLGARVCVVSNPQPEQGMLSSIWAGLEALGGAAGLSGFLLHLVDLPGVQPSSVHALLARHRRTPDAILVPTWVSRDGDGCAGGKAEGAGELGEGEPRGLPERRRRGHPVLFPACCAGELRAAPLDGGARTVVRSNPARVIEVELADVGVCSDVDTPEDYQRALASSLGAAT